MQVRLLHHADEVGHFQLEDIEPIANTSFKQMLDERHVILIARVKTRDKQNFRKTYYHYYYGPNLIKILFQALQLPTESILRSRYHNLYPITSKDPITNQVIVGEVEFYTLGEQNTDAEFFGTDFNYASSKLFRERFDELTPEKELLDLGIRNEQPG